MRELKRLVVLLPLILSPGFAAKKPKPPRPPTQPNIIVECITVSNIHSHSLGLLRSSPFLFRPRTGLPDLSHGEALRPPARGHEAREDHLREGISGVRRGAV